jgi:hypothetical protein
MADREVTVRVNLQPGTQGGGLIPPDQIQILRDAQRRAGPSGGQLLTAAGGAVTAAATGNLPGAVASLGGPFAALGAAAAGVLTAWQAWEQMLRRSLPTLADFNSRLQRGTEALAEARTAGAVSGESLLRAIGTPGAIGPGGGALVQALRQAQSDANYPRQLQLLQQIERSAQAQVARIETRDPAGGRVAIEALIQELRTGARAGVATREQEQRLAQLWERHVGGPLPAELQRSAFTNIQAFWARMTDEQAAQAGRSVIGPLMAAVGAREAARVARGPAGIPSLRPGAPEFPEGAFRAGRGDILDLHAALQAEAARDPREEARFQALYRLLEEWRAEMRRIGSPLGGVPGAVGP